MQSQKIGEERSLFNSFYEARNVNTKKSFRNILKTTVKSIFLMHINQKYLTEH